MSPVVPHGAMLLGTFLVASSFPVSAAIAGDLDGGLLTLLRFAAGALLFLPIVAIRHRREVAPSLGLVARHAAISAPLVVYLLGVFEALRTTSAVSTGALFTLAPVFAALFARLLLGERLDARRAVALGTAAVGAVWVVFRGDPERLLGLDAKVGDAVFLAGTVAFGLHAVLVKRLHRGEPVAVSAFWILVTGFGLLLPLYATQLVALDWGALPPRVLGGLAYLSVFTTLVTFTLSQFAVARLGPTRALSYNYLTPTLVVLLAWAAGDGAPGWATAPGIALSLVSMAVLQRGAPAATRLVPAAEAPPSTADGVRPARAG